MAELILTGFHAVEEKVRNAEINKDSVSSMQIFYSKPGPRIKKILEQAKKAGIYIQTYNNVDILTEEHTRELDYYVSKTGMIYKLISNIAVSLE